MLTIALVLTVFMVVGLILYCCCVVSGRSSRMDEELEDLSRLNNAQNNEL